MPRRERPDQQIQKAIIDHLKTRGAPDVVYPHPANGGARSAVEGAILKGMGVAAGAPDLLLWHNRKAYALELKAEGGASPMCRLT
jgi:hypothetical protein